VPRGLLKLSSSDSLGPNPWTRVKPVASEFGLTSDDFNDKELDAAREASRAELIEYPWRFTSAFLVPVTFVLGLFAWNSGLLDAFTTGVMPDPTSLPAFEWAAYLGLSLILGAIVSTIDHYAEQKEIKRSAVILATTKKRKAFDGALKEWNDDLRKRTTTSFWREGIHAIAQEKGSTPTAVFSQEVAKLFAAWGWSVKLNQRAQDFGVDMFANGKDGSAIVQCKHLDTSPATQDVRDLAGCRHAFGADFGLLVSIHPPSTARHNGFFSDKGQLEFWHLGHLLEQCITLYKQRTGEDAPPDATRAEFLNSDGTPISWQVDKKDEAA
jgi:hypothetical protein